MPSRSKTPAECAFARITSPSVSTSKCRFPPLTFLPGSKPRPSPPTPMVLTDCESAIPALGCGSRPMRTRVLRRSASYSLSQVPSRRQRRKPEAEVVVDRLPRREVAGKQAAKRRRSLGRRRRRRGSHARGRVWGGRWSSERARGLDAGPLFVGEVGLVCLPHSARYPTEPPPPHPFSDGFLHREGSEWPGKALV